jgi:hypothetical protein
MPKYVPRLEGIMHDQEGGSALCLLTLGHISAYNMDNTILFTGAAVIFSHHQVCIKKKKGGHFLGGQK